MGSQAVKRLELIESGRIWKSHKVIRSKKQKQMSSERQAKTSYICVMRLVSFRFSIVSLSLCFTHKKFDSRWLHLIPILGSLCKQKSRSCSLPVVTTPQYWGIVNDMSTKAWPIFLWQILVPHSERVVLIFLPRTVSILSCLAKLDQFGSFHGVILATKHMGVSNCSKMFQLCVNLEIISTWSKATTKSSNKSWCHLPKNANIKYWLAPSTMYITTMHERKNTTSLLEWRSSTITMPPPCQWHSQSLHVQQREGPCNTRYLSRFGDTFRTKQKHQRSSGANPRVKQPKVERAGFFKVSPA